jgi:hypothetical protein
VRGGSISEANASLQRTLKAFFKIANGDFMEPPLPDDYN